MYFGSSSLTESTFCRCSSTNARLDLVFFFGVGIVFQFGEARSAAELLSDAVLLLSSDSL